MSEDRDIRALYERLQRIETRLVAGFEAMGISVTSPEDWCTVDLRARAVYLRGPSRSIKSLQLAIYEAKGDTGFYDVFFNGQKIALVKGVDHVN